MSEESDALFEAVKVYVHGRVPTNYENTVTEIVCRTVVLIMTTPKFLNNLSAIQELQAENWNLRQALIAYQQAEMARVNRARARAAKKAPTAKKATAKKAPARKSPAKKAPASNVRAFKRGATGR